VNIIAVGCDKSGIPALLRVKQECRDNGVVLEIIPVPCLGTVRESWLLELLEGEVDALLLAGCPLDSCHNLEGSRYARDRVLRVNALLREADIPKQVLIAIDTAEKIGEIRRILKEYSRLKVKDQ